MIRNLLRLLLVPYVPWMNHQVFYVDGTFYRWSGWLGCQITSHRWTRPAAGTRIRVLGEDLTIYSTRRRGLVVDCNWCLTRLPDDIDGANTVIRAFAEKLRGIN